MDGEIIRIYTVPVTVGAANQTFAVQVDTGSADFVRVSVVVFSLNST